jgi:D-alanyl-D-alanine carboxypeptidase/D-alanyl-D-alanine-endopeptidase (penicillin-binding protein 4)
MNPKSTGFRESLTDVVTGLCVLLLGVTASSAASGTALPSSVVDLMQAHGIPENSISVVMRKVGTNQNTISHNATTPRNPASAMKLVTTAAALQLLGPQHRWRTHAFVRGKVHGNTLEGDLILRGSGDPWLVIERFWLLAKQLRGRGITHIGGDLVIDDTLFDRRTIEEKAIDGKSTRAYNTPPNALLVNFGTTSLIVESDDNAVYVSVDPPAATLQIRNTITLSNAACGGKGRSIRLDLKRSTFVTKLSVGGRYPVGCGASTFRRTLLPHGQYVYGVFKALWQQLGGTLAGGWRYGKTPARAVVAAELESVPLAEVIRYINKFSNNVMARNLLLTLATDHPPSTPTKGRHVIENWLSQSGVAMPALHIDNGAGLSREARVSAQGLAALLGAAANWPWWPEFLGSLPIATVDGSLRKRFHNVAGPGRLRLKTGLLKNVRALAGYAIDRNGDIWVVVVLHNHPQASSSVGIEIQHRLLETLFQ